ncbi:MULTISPECIES: RNA 2',3'-cyclic phosphodiesterase [unclassified Exiguobacterium]|uniref:RNA 2',3'-cyclic phosphodiesterase n=1 Tax=unclassified Exiguobacterium TaxID=2644629 RepID=UPI00103C76F6|nr:MULTISPECIES: RNA 2',3'-cyclic phosphodiesterase [unclassified Exiguobacterium]TCI47854.1 RNA 2',3'-cyclic phosphodiesterase [Exiguobacterium sp. SH5S32]TCI54738.1 RNA 2',3'-cyclic phosphodiesterase [Exiguobacterium sp. SH1S4]TCI74534.1 RNA 2',3'-cyclic phosphodiesterase [Exiguobacterium sp. SH1S1]TCI80822.1 RNA 2',3'-cyclic phosphodiesterase [Exiguobacterium sp. SH0S1]
MSTHYFIALPIEARQFEQIQRDILPFYSYRRVYRPEEFHLTLQFLGALDDDQVEAVKEITRDVAHETAPFTLRFQQIDHFGRPDRPRVLTIIPNPSVALSTFVSTLRRKLAEEISAIDRKPFAAHVTLAKKWDTGERIPYIAPAFDVEEAITEVVLYRINPTKTPAYEAVEVFPLAHSEEDTWRSRLKFLT